jgi:hypothetical protein
MWSVYLPEYMEDLFSSRSIAISAVSRTTMEVPATSNWIMSESVMGRYVSCYCDQLNNRKHTKFFGPVMISFPGKALGHVK